MIINYLIYVLITLIYIIMLNIVVRFMEETKKVLKDKTDSIIKKIIYLLVFASMIAGCLWYYFEVILVIVRSMM